MDHPGQCDRRGRSQQFPQYPVFWPCIKAGKSHAAGSRGRFLRPTKNRKTSEGNPGHLFQFQPDGPGTGSNGNSADRFRFQCFPRI